MTQCQSCTAEATLFVESKSRQRENHEAYLRKKRGA